jgi:preprotein translocase subunit SecD
VNRYPLWKYAILVVALLIGVLYTLPNFFGEDPAVQVSAARSSVRVDASTQARIQQALAQAGIKPLSISQDANSIKVRLDNTDTQLKAKDAIQRVLAPNPNDAGYVVALNLLSKTPAWMASINARPMYLGLDLRGGVHFMLQVDMQAALTKRAESLAGDLRTVLREKNVRHAGIERSGQTVLVRFRDPAALAAARNVLTDQFPDLQVAERADGDATCSPAASSRSGAQGQDQALKQNMVTLHNRINELGVAEPVIQQQGVDRIVVQLPGVQDTSRAKDILGRTATLEVRMVDESTEGPRGRGRDRTGAVRRRTLPGPRRPRRGGEEAGHPDRREPHGCPGGLRQPDPGAGGAPDPGREGRAHLPRHHTRQRRQAHGDPAL